MLLAGMKPRSPHRASSAQLRLLGHMARCDGGWLPEDAQRVTASMLTTMESRGWITLERMQNENGVYLVGATLTKLGRAALRWGEARVIR